MEYRITRGDNITKPSADELYHWKYVKKVKKNGKWRYYYDVKDADDKTLSERVDNTKEALERGYADGNIYKINQKDRLNQIYEDEKALRNDAERWRKVNHPRGNELDAIADSKDGYRKHVISTNSYKISNFVGRRVRDVEDFVDSGKHAVNKFLETNRKASKAFIKEFRKAY